MSINLCTDQLLLTVAAPEQIASLSWLAWDQNDSALADEAEGHLPNYGAAEELITINPDLVLTGRYTANFTGELAQRLGFEVLEIPPADSVDAVIDNLRLLARRLDREGHTESIIADMGARLEIIAANRPRSPIPAVFVREGGFTVAANSLTNDLMVIGGLRNVAAAAGLDRWGSLSMEALLSSGAAVMIVSSYRNDSPSLTNQTLNHPAFRVLSRRTRVRTVPAKLLACGGPWSVLAGEIMTGKTPPGPL